MKQAIDHYTRDAFGFTRGRPTNEERGLPRAHTNAERQANWRARQEQKKRDERRAQLAAAEAAELYCREMTQAAIAETLNEATNAGDREQAFTCWVEIGRRNGWLK